MGRLTEMFAYLNSTAEDWQSGKLTYDMFKSYNITDEAKKVRQGYQNGRGNYKYLHKNLPDKK